MSKMCQYLKLSYTHAAIMLTSICLPYAQNYAQHNSPVWTKQYCTYVMSPRCCQMFVSHTSQKAQLRAPLSPLQTTWTGFDPNSYSSGPSSAGPALVEIATARSFILNRGIVTDTMSATPLEPGW